MGTHKTVPHLFLCSLASIVNTEFAEKLTLTQQNEIVVTLLHEAVSSPLFLPSVSSLFPDTFLIIKVQVISIPSVGISSLSQALVLSLVVNVCLPELFSIGETTNGAM